jgi:hypothetical protein
MGRPLLVISAISAIVGVTVSGLALSVGIRENPQGEFIDTTTGAIDYAYVLFFFLAGSVPIFAATFALGLALWFGAKGLRRLSHRTRK